MWDAVILRDGANPSFYAEVELLLRRAGLNNIALIHWDRPIPSCKVLLGHARGLSRFFEVARTRLISLGGRTPVITEEILDDLFMLDPFGYRQAAKKTIKNKVRENAKKKQSPKKLTPPAQKKPTPTEKIKARNTKPSKKEAPKQEAPKQEAPKQEAPKQEPANKENNPLSKKPIYTLIEEKYAKRWRGENPLSGKSVGFWTVKGWLHSKDKDLKKYAESVFKGFKDSVKEDQKEGVLKEVMLPDIIDNGVFPVELIKQQTLSFNIDIEKPISNQSFDYLTENIRRSFRTQGYNRNFVEQYVDKKIEGYKSIIKLFTKPIMSLFSKQKKDRELERFGDLAEVFDEAQNTNKALKLASSSFAVEFAMDTIIPKLGELTNSSIITDFFTVDGLGAVVTKGIVAKFPVAAKVAALTIPKAIPFIGGSPIVAGIVTIGVGMVVGSIISKMLTNKVQSDEYDEITVDVFRGELTPEDMEKTFNKRLDAILKKNIPREQMQKEMQALYDEFQTEVRPAIEKALYMAGKNVGKGSEGGSFDMFKFLKTGSDSSKPKAVVRMRRVLESIRIEKLIERALITKGFNETLTKVLRGDLPMNPEFLKSLHSYLPKG
jgi:hypothetical protein